MPQELLNQARNNPTISKYIIGFLYASFIGGISLTIGVFFVILIIVLNQSSNRTKLDKIDHNIEVIKKSIRTQRQPK